MNDPQQLGEALASALGSGPSRATLATQRARVIDAMQRSTRPHASLRWPAVAVAAFALSLGGFFIHRASTQQLQAQFRGQTVGESARLVAAAKGEALEFSDGSSLMLSDRAEISVSRLSRERAQVEMAGGRVQARIRKDTGRAWAINAGPYSVRVVGTEFTVDWDPAQAVLAVDVTEGKVMVFGGDLPASGVGLSRGERLIRRAAEPASASAQAAREPRDPTVNRPSRQPEAAPESPTSRAAPANAEPSWRQLATGSKYAPALHAAEREGFEQLLVDLPEKDLLLLANTARYAGSPARARQALSRLRERFSGSGSASVAALLLAGLAEDHAKNESEAASWLRVFLKESPHGELAAGARARLLGILLRQGKQLEAERVARDYLRYHPTGTYAEKARNVLGTSSTP